MLVKITAKIVGLFYHFAKSRFGQRAGKVSGVAIIITLLLQLHRYNGAGTYIKPEWHYILPILAAPFIFLCIGRLLVYVVDQNKFRLAEFFILSGVFFIYVAATQVSDMFPKNWIDQGMGVINWRPLLMPGVVALIMLSILLFLSRPTK